MPRKDGGMSVSVIWILRNLLEDEIKQEEIERDEVDQQIVEFEKDIEERAKELAVGTENAPLFLFRHRAISVTTGIAI